MATPLYLGLDLGTTNVKALVIDAQGQPRGEGACGIHLTPVGDGGVEQDINEIWSATLSALRAALASVDARAVAALGVSSQGGALQLLTPDQHPLGRVVSWLDQRGRHDDERLTAALGRPWFRERIRHGRCALAPGQLLRLRREQPAWLTAPNRVGFVGDTIVGRLCGRAAHDATSAGLTLLLNPHQGGYDPDLLAQLGLHAGQLPDLLPATASAGGLTAEVAAATGLRPGLPVSPAIHDQYASALSTGAVEPGVVMVGAGTAWVLLAVSQGLPPLVMDDAFVCTHVVPELGGEILSLVNGGSALTWVLGLLGRAQATPAEIEALIATAPPGCDGLRAWPFLTPFGASGLAAGTRGRFTGLQLGHTPAHFARAVIEGLACELARHLQFLEQAGIPAQRLVLGGTVAASDTTTRIIADVTALPLGCSGPGGGSVLGAAILARALTEPGTALATLSRALQPPVRWVNPGPHSAAYRTQLAEYLAALPREIPSPAAPMP